MAAPPQPPPQRGTMSLYEDLLGGGSNAEPSAGAATTAAPVASPKPAPDAAKSNPALRFQPIIRRPQQTKARAKAPLPKKPAASIPLPTSTPAPPLSSSSSSAGPASQSTSAPAPARTTTTLADWTAGDGENEDDYEDERAGGWAQRGGRKRKKGRRAREEEAAAAAEAMLHTDYWDELYDPARPTNLEAYLHSDERVAAAREWKRVLYAHRRATAATAAATGTRRGRSSSHSDRDSDSDSAHTAPNRAPPSAAFAPPPSLTTTTPAASAAPPETHQKILGIGTARPVEPEATEPEDDTMGDALPSTDDNTMHSKDAPQGPPDPTPIPPPPQQGLQQPQQTRTPASSSIASLADGLIISKAPVRFAAASAAPAPAAPAAHETRENDNHDDNELSENAPPPSRRPGQAGFAARLMTKYGWTKGAGLGVDESGIVNPLRHKREGGAGAAGSGNKNMGRIVGGGRARTSASETERDPPPPSPVIVLRHMLDGLALDDLAAEVADGQLVQEIGEECGEQYGRVQRVHVATATRLVFLQFTETVSALRAVHALQGRIFNGNAIDASFYDEDKFDAGIYE